ncbi:hypothetical protein Trydic_g23760 [Trypoxylus dichotomus]
MPSFNSSMVCHLLATAFFAMPQMYEAGEFENAPEEIDELRQQYDKFPRPDKKLDPEMPNSMHNRVDRDIH